MNALEEFYLKLDLSDWDAIREGEISIALLEVSETLMKEGLSEVQHFAEVDRQVFLFNGSPERPRSYKPIGGNEKEDFNHLFKRFRETKNIYAKTEYGLVFYYSKKKHDDEFVIELLNSLFSLLKSYIYKLEDKTDNYSYVISYIRPLLGNTFQIANNHKSITEVNKIYKSLIEYLYQLYLKWGITQHSAIVIIMMITDFANDYYDDFKQYVENIVNKNWEAAQFLANADAKQPLYIIEPTIKLCHKAMIDDKQWLNFEAQQYEKMAIELFERNNQMVAISYVERALSIYKNIMDSENINRLEKIYQQWRSKIELKDIPFEIPIEESQRINQIIKAEVQNQNEDGVIKILMFTPMLPSLAEIKKESLQQLQSSSLLNIFHTVIYDKFGNVTDQLNDKNRENFALNWMYSFRMQIASQTIMQFFIEALFANKISADSILNYLKTTWIGIDRTKYFHGKPVTINYLKSIESGINNLFRELEKWKNEPEPDLICVTDSLILKNEYLLREICYFLDIPTFQQKKDVVIEKSLDHILNNLTDKLQEDDHYFIKFILVEKGGYNLRNKIAHGLMDNIEYGLQYPILALIIILKLSNYQFVKNKN